MTSFSDDFINGFNNALDYGQIARIKYYTQSFGAGSYYDDDVALTQSGTNLWISGVVLPITQNRGSNDAVLLQQGKIFTNDTKLYIRSNISTSGIIKIGLGSYTNMSGCEYSVIDEGIISWGINNVPIYKKLYIRYLTNGSLMGE
jgi:hypothetical protein